MESKRIATDDKNNTANSALKVSLPNERNIPNSMACKTHAMILEVPEICKKRRRISFSTENQLFSAPTPNELHTILPKNPTLQSKYLHTNGETCTPIASTVGSELSHWIRTYRKAFPSFSFYFDQVDERLQRSFVNKIRLLGGGVECFFSTKVTHLICTGSIPPLEKELRNIDVPTIISPRLPLDTSEVFAQGPDQSNIRNLSKASRKSKGIANSIEPRAEQTIQELKNRISLNPSLTSIIPSSASKIRKSQGLKIYSPGKVSQPVFGASSSKANIINKGRQWGMKVWSIDKLNNILKHLLHTPLSTLIQTNRSLADVLRDEKTYELCTRAGHLSSFVPDIHIFKKIFLLVEDTTRTYRTVMIGEFAPPADGQDPPWPKIYRNIEGRCPFIAYEELMTASPKKLYTPTFKRDPSYDTNLNNIINSNASGMVNSFTCAYISATRRDRIMSCLQPKDVDKFKKNASDPGKSIKKVGMWKQMALDSSKRMPSPPTKVARKPGYCENCRLKFNDLEEVCMYHIYFLLSIYSRLASYVAY
ncbi:Cdc7p-Dbf4p kinase complex regulatory subunit, variant 2 [Basidiobolus ranarum]|uniref:Cdc7p-Dbf4p kinase complex regulatory subunit, variant 2 n=1 Tax=Basidiobolus ranarum TaxID=34480 RepID=A0ABR2WLW0_9FUNG